MNRNKNLFEKFKLYRINIKRKKLEKSEKNNEIKKVNTQYKKQSKIKIFFKFIIGFFFSFLEYFATKSNKKNYNNFNNKTLNNRNDEINLNEKNKVDDYNKIKIKQQNTQDKIKDNVDYLKNLKLNLAIIEDQIIYANNNDDLKYSKNKIYKLKEEFEVKNNDIKSDEKIMNNYERETLKYKKYGLKFKHFKNEKKLNENKILKNDEENKIFKRFDEDVELINLKSNLLYQQDKFEEKISIKDNELEAVDSLIKVKKIGQMIENMANDKNKFDDNLVEFDQFKLINNKNEHIEDIIEEHLNEDTNKLNNKGINNINIEKDTAKSLVTEEDNNLKKGVLLNNRVLDNKTNMEEKLVNKAISKQDIRTNDKINSANEYINSLNITNSNINDKYYSTLSNFDELSYYIKNPRNAISFTANLDMIMTRTIQFSLNLVEIDAIAHSRLGVVAGAYMINNMLSNHRRNIYRNDIEQNLNMMYRNTFNNIGESIRLCEESNSKISEIKRILSEMPKEVKETENFKSVLIKCNFIEKENNSYSNELKKIAKKNKEYRVLINERNL